MFGKLGIPCLSDHGNSSCRIIHFRKEAVTKVMLIRAYDMRAQ